MKLYHESNNFKEGKSNSKPIIFTRQHFAMLRLRSQTTAFRLICNAILSGRKGLERPEIDTRGVTQTFCSVFIFIPSDHCKILAVLKSVARLPLISEDFFFFLEEHVVFPSKLPAEKNLSKPSLCQL